MANSIRSVPSNTAVPRAVAGRLSRLDELGVIAALEELSGGDLTNPALLHTMATGARP